MKQIPIKASYITLRKATTAAANEGQVFLPSRNFTNEEVLMRYAKDVSHSTESCNNCGFTIVFESVEKLDKEEGKPHNQVHNFIQNEIIPKLNKKSLKFALEKVEESNDEFLDKESYKAVLEDSLVIDRILTNEKSLSKRFNFDKLASTCKRSNKGCADTVYEMCDLIDTYDISPEAKFNIALENVTYTMGKVGIKSDEVSKAVVDYFLLKPVIPDAVYETAQSLVKNCRLLSESDKSDLSYFTEAKNDEYKKNITALACKCTTGEAKELIISSTSIKSEKEASAYIKKAVVVANDSPDGKHIVASIFTIPLRGKVSKSFVAYQYRLARDKNKITKKFDKDFDKKIEDIIDNEDDNFIKEASLFGEDDEYIEEGQSTIIEVEDNYYPNTAIMESEDFAESEDIKKILGQFKAEQKKSIGKFKYYLGKIYRKSPESIIDETPNILGIIRIVFVLAPASLPVIGIPLSLVVAFVDRMIAMKINETQTERLIKKLDAEIEKTNKDIEKKPQRKEELERYKKCLETNLKKVESYRKTITDHEVPGRESKNDSDFDFGDDLDFGLEQTLVALNAMGVIMNAYENNFTESVCSIFDEVIKEEPINYINFSGILEVCANCGDSINLTEFFNKANEFRSENANDSVQLAMMGTALNSVSYNLEQYKASTGMTLDRIISEAYYTEQLQDVVNEGFKLSKLKLLFQLAKEKGKDLSTKEKAFWRNADIYTSAFMRNIEKAMTSDRREGIIKGSLIPSFSKCMKSAIAIGAISFVNPVLGLITAMGMIGVSKKLNRREKQLIYDEIETELKVVEKEIEMANNDGDMKKYRCMLQYQKKLERERQRIKYGIKAHGRDAVLYKNTSPKGE